MHVHIIFMYVHVCVCVCATETELHAENVTLSLIIFTYHVSVIYIFNSYACIFDVIIMFIKCMLTFRLQSNNILAIIHLQTTCIQYDNKTIGNICSLYACK